MKKTALLTLSGLAAFLAVPASASTLFDLTTSSPAISGLNGTSITYSATVNSSPVSFSAYGYTYCSGTIASGQASCAATTGTARAVSLVVKTAALDGATKAGLGLVNDAAGCTATANATTALNNCEISHGSFIQLDLHNFTAGTTITLSVASNTGTDGYQFYSSTALGTLGTAATGTGNSGVGTGNASYTYTIPTNNAGNYLSLYETGAGSANVNLGATLTINAASQTSTPEPASMLTMGGGLLALSMVMKKKIASRK